MLLQHRLAERERVRLRPGGLGGGRGFRDQAFAVAGADRLGRGRGRPVKVEDVDQRLLLLLLLLLDDGGSRLLLLQLWSLLLLLLLLLEDLRSTGWPRGVPSTSPAAAAPRRSRTTATAAASTDRVPESAATLLIWSVPSTYMKSSAKTGIDDSQPAQGQSGGNVPEAPWWHEARGGVRAFC
jgi:hypothetical protein